MSHLVVCVGEQCILGVHQDSAGLLLQPIEGGGLHRDVRGLLVTVKDLGGHHVLQDKTTVTRSRLSQDRVVGVIIFNGVRVKKKKNLSDTEDDVGVFVALVCVQTLAVVPEQIPGG